MAGVTGTVAPSGELNAGNVSVSGQRETANGFLVNGGDVQEHMNGGTSIVPNLDSIEEFRVLTNNFDPQYGNYNGGIVNVITKSGSDNVHGNLFEFFRNTALDQRSYFSPEKATFKQNQPGGTIGGPLKKGKVFVFADYQATRTTQGIETGLLSVPSSRERSGNFSSAADTLNGSVNGQYWANLLASTPRICGHGPASRTTFPAVHELRAMRVPECHDSDQRMVAPGRAPVAVHTGAEQRRRAVLHRRVREDRARRQGWTAHGREHPVGSALRLLLRRRLPPRRSVSRASREGRTCRASTR